MRNTAGMASSRKSWRRTVGAFTAAGIFLGASVAYADEPVTMAPPVPVSSVPGDTPADASQDTVFNWKEVPMNQRVTIIRAVFDQGGYQIYDDVGETIVVPFTNHNLYVMKFGQSRDGAMHFTNDGSEPVLYVPRNGYLENATVPGGKWYPFPHDTRADRPADPVFLGIAPNWPDYVDMGWYPDMDYYGGYYCREPFAPGIALVPTYGLSITIGDQPYYGWADYHDYCEYHPAPYHEEVANANVYHWGNRPDWGQRQFVGGDTGFAQRNFSGDRAFGAGRFSDNPPAARSFVGADHGPAGRPFPGRDANPVRAPRTFGGGGRIFRGGQRTQDAPADSGPAPVFNSPSATSPTQTFSNIPRTFSNTPDFGGGGGNAGRQNAGGGGGGGGNVGSARSSSSGGGGGRQASGGGGFSSGGHRR